MELGIGFVPGDVSEAVSIAQLAESSNIGWLGLADSTYLYADPYCVLVAIAQATRRIRIGTLVTNPVTRHWSVQAAACRTLGQLAPERVYLGIAPGDSAVHSVGLKPASPSELAEYVLQVRRGVQFSLPVMVAAGGPRSVIRATQYADHIVIGQGASVASLRSLMSSAASHGREHPMPAQLWIFLVLNLADDERERTSARREVRSAVIGYSRQAFDHTFEHKEVAGSVQLALKRLYSQYSFNDHARPGQTANTRLLETEEFKELDSFLIDRFAMVDTPEQAAERLVAIFRQTGISNAFLFLGGAIPKKTMSLMAGRMLPALKKAMSQ